MSTAAIYASFYPGLKQVAEQHGYALAIHGSLNRDFDLVAIPWIEDAADSETLSLGRSRIALAATLALVTPYLSSGLTDGTAGRFGWTGSFILILRLCRECDMRKTLPFRIILQRLTSVRRSNNATQTTYHNQM